MNGSEASKHKIRLHLGTDAGTRKKVEKGKERKETSIPSEKDVGIGHVWFALVMLLKTPIVRTDLWAVLNNSKEKKAKKI